MVAPDPRRQRRRLGRRHRVTVDARGRWRRVRRPLLYLAVAGVPLPVVLLQAAGRPLWAGLVLVGVVLLVRSDLTCRRRGQRRAAERERTARLEHLEAVLELIYDDWIGLEAARGQADLERWRRTHRT